MRERGERGERENKKSKEGANWDCALTICDNQLFNRVKVDKLTVFIIECKTSYFNSFTTCTGFISIIFGTTAYILVYV